MNAKFGLSAPCSEALARLSDGLSEHRENLLSILIPAMTEELEASRQRRTPTNDPIRYNLQMLCDLEDFMSTINLLTGRDPNAKNLSKETLLSLIPYVANYETKYSSLKNAFDIDAVIKSDTVSTELEGLLKTEERDSSYVKRVGAGRSKIGSWFRGRGGKESGDANPN
jgi:hypothetical protein